MSAALWRFLDGPRMRRLFARDWHLGGGVFEGFVVGLVLGFAWGWSPKRLGMVCLAVDLGVV